MIPSVLYIVCMTAFLAVSVKHFGIPYCYSHLAYLWDERKPKGYVMELVTMALAVMMSVGLAYVSEWAPAAAFLLMGVPVASRYLDTKREHIVHTAWAIASAAAAFAWMWSVGGIWIAFSLLAILAVAAVATKTVKSSWLLWLEMVMFYGVPLAVLFELLKTH